MAAPTTAQDVPTFRLAAPDHVATVERFGPAVRFKSVSSIRELPDGHMLVADMEYLEWGQGLVWIDWDAGEARPVTPPTQGMRGSRPLGLHALRGDSTLFTSFSTREWVILADTVVVRFYDDGLVDVVEELGPDLAGADPTGRVVGSRRHPYSVGNYRESPDTLVLLLGNPDEAPVDTLTRLRGRGQFLDDELVVPSGDGMVFLAHPYRTEEMARYLPDRWTAVARMDPYRVDWRTPEGRWILGEPLPIDLEAVDQTERCFQLEAFLGSCELSGELDWPDVVPPFVLQDRYERHRFEASTLLATPQGNLLVRRTPVAGGPERGYDVIDRRGRLVAELLMPRNVMVVGFGDASVYTVEADVSDPEVPERPGTETLRRHPWHVPGS